MRRPTPRRAARSTRGSPPAARCSPTPEARPTAVIAQSDLLAAGVIRAAEEAGLRVPEDLSVTGFDGIVVDGLAPYELTTLVQPATDKGRAAGQAVAAHARGPGGRIHPLHVRVPRGQHDRPRLRPPRGHELPLGAASAHFW